MEPKRIDFIDEDGVLLYENVASKDQLENWYNRSKSYAQFRRMGTASKGDLKQAWAWMANFNSEKIIEEINSDPTIKSKVSDVDKQLPQGFLVLEEIWTVISAKIDHKLEVQQQYINAFNHGDNTWGHTDWYDYTVIFYPNPEWDSQVMGGETLFFNDDYDYIRCAVACKPGNVVIFKGDIPHKAGLVSRETNLARLSVVYQCKGEI